MLSINNNILQTIVSFLPIQSTAAMSSVNKSLNASMSNSFNYKWREECNKYFYYPKNDSATMDCFHYDKELDIRSIPNEINWKGQFKQMMTNRQALRCYNSNEAFNHFTEQFEHFELELFDALRNSTYLPRLRKPNTAFESSFNSPHQLFFFDYKMEEEFLYRYYDKQFMHLQENDSRRQFILRNDNLPLGDFILDFNQILNDLKTRPDGIAFLNEAMNYNFTNSNEVDSESNPLIYFIGKLYNYIRDYCIFTMNYLLKYSNESHSRNKISNQNDIMAELFWNEYIQRYESFISGALILNEQLENFNVCINYINAHLINSSTATNGNSTGHKKKRFNVYKMIYNIWYNEVVLQLASKGLFDSHLPTFLNAYFNEELVANKINVMKEAYNGRDIDLVLPEYNNLDCNDEDDKFGLTKRDLIKSIANCFLDTNCNEDTVCTINHSEVASFEFYNSFDLMFSSIGYKVLCDKIHNGDLNKEKVLDYMRNELGCTGLNLIKKTKKSFMKTIALSLKESLHQQLITGYSFYLVSYANTNTNTRQNVTNQQQQLISNTSNDAFISQWLSLEFKDIQKLLINNGITSHNLSKVQATNIANYFIYSNDITIHFMKQFYIEYYTKLNQYLTNDNKILMAIDNQLQRERTEKATHKINELTLIERTFNNINTKYVDS